MLLLLLLLLLSGLPLVRAVWPNYEVVVFHLQAGTAPNWGSAANFRYGLNPTLLLLILFWVFCFPLSFAFLRPPYILYYDWATLSSCTPFPPISSGLVLPVHIDKLSLPPESTNRLCVFWFVILNLLHCIHLILIWISSEVIFEDFFL